MTRERVALLMQRLAAPLDALWRLGVSPQAWVALALAAAAVIALGLALPQAPSGLAGDPEALARWQVSLQAERGAWLAWPARLGLLSLYNSPLVRLLAAALAFVTLLALADTLGAWRAAARQAASRPWLPVVAPGLGLLLLLGGAVVEEHWGWEQERLLLGSDRPVALGLGGRSLALQVWDRPAPAEEAPVRWREGAREGEATLRRGQPLALFPLTVHLLQAGPALRLRVQGPDGQMISLDDPAAGNGLQPEAVLRFHRVGEERILSLPARDWVVHVAYPRTDLSGDLIVLTVYRSLGDDSPLAQAPVSGAGTLSVEDYRFEWQLLPYAELRAALHPGLPLWALGWLLMVVGLGAGPAAGWNPRRWLWAPAALALGAAIWLAVGGPAATAGRPLAMLGALFQCVAGSILLLGAPAALPARRRLTWAFLSEWPSSLGWALCAWTLAGALLFLAQWIEAGAFWRWEPAQARWASTWLVLAAGWRRQRVVGRDIKCLDNDPRRGYHRNSAPCIGGPSNEGGQG